MLKKDVPIIWGEDEVKAWEMLKKLITEPPALAYPRVGWLYRLHTDASKIGTAYMVTQVQAEEEWRKEHLKEDKLPTIRSSERPVAYGSTGMRGYQLNYTVTEMELFAVARGVQ